MGRVVCPRRGHTTPRVSAVEILTTDLGLLYSSNSNVLIYDSHWTSLLVPRSPVSVAEVSKFSI